MKKNRYVLQWGGVVSNSTVVFVLVISLYEFEYQRRSYYWNEVVAYYEVLIDYSYVKNVKLVGNWSSTIRCLTKKTWNLRLYYPRLVGFRRFKLFSSDWLIQSKAIF